MSSRLRAVLLAVLLAGGCSPASPGSLREDVSGVYTRAGFHFVLQCEGDATPHIVEYIYPANVDADTFRVTDDGGVLAVYYGATQIGFGHRSGRRASIHLAAIDDQPGSAVDWTLEGEVDASVPYHSRLFSGHLAPAVLPGITINGGECVFDERSVFWWSEEPEGDLGPESIATSGDDALLGDYTLFAWWAKLGTVSPVPGKGPDRATAGGDMVSLAISTHTSIVRESGALAMDDHVVSTPGRGIGDARALWFRQVDHELVDVMAAQALIVNDLQSGGVPGVRRLLVGWLQGRLYIDPSTYPPGLTGPMGWTDISRPGIVFWEEVDYGAAGSPGFAPEKTLRVTAMNLAGRQAIVDGLPLP